MRKQHSFLNSYALQLIEKGKCSPSIGLWDGKMGLAISILHVFRITNNDRYRNEAYELIDNIYDHMCIQMPLGFEHGLTGIGCGFQYLINNGFVDADSDDVLSEIDSLIKKAIENRSLDSLCLRNGVSGIAFYLYHRLISRQDIDNNILVQNIKGYSILLIEWLEYLILRADNVGDINDAYFIFCRLHKLNISNNKIERLLSYCLRRLLDFNCEIIDNYKSLGIQSLKALSPWILDSQGYNIKNNNTRGN